MVVYKKQDFLKHMPDVKKYDEYISSLNEKWENLKLLCEINCPVHSKNILPAMAGIQGGFSDLQQKLIETLISETMNKIEQKIVSKAQVAIDILIRNLYERTADVGFLSTDGDIRKFAKLHSPNGDERETIVNRLREYVAKYSVYEDIIIVSTDGCVLANLNESNPIAGQILKDPILDCTLKTKDKFVESFQPSVLQPAKKNAHIFSHKIVDENTGEVLGVLCLCFRFYNELKTIFKKLSIDYDGSVITIIDSKNKVLASSDDAHVPPNTTVETFGSETYEVVYYRGQEYIVRTVSTQGYQDYYGLGWKGHIMIPLSLAFQEKAVLSGVDKNTLDLLMSKTDSLSEELNDIIKQTRTITRSLKWIVCNGQIIARNVDANDESYKLKPVLNSIGKVGVQTGELFQSSVHNLFATLISTDLVDVRFMASLCVDIMDRNLYERADDCRWWAMNPTFRELLAVPGTLSEDARAKLTSILSHIHSLYTVYSNLLLFDNSGTIVAVSNPKYLS
ncbi:MAG: cache domain-containing protein, partial [Bacillota bacterium]